MIASPGARVRSLVAAFLVVDGAANLVMVLLFGDLYRRFYTLRLQQQGGGGAAALGSVEGAMTVLVGITVVVAVVYAALAALTLWRPRAWVLWLDAAVLLVAGLPTLAGRAIEVFSPTRAAVPPVFGQTQLLLSLIAVGLAGALLAGLAGALRPRVRRQETA